MDALTKEAIRKHYILHMYLLLTSIQALLLPLPTYRKKGVNRLDEPKKTSNEMDIAEATEEQDK